MATTRTVRTTAPGPVRFKSKTLAIDVLVIADGDLEHGEVTISTADDDGPSADLVKTARLTADGTRLEVDVNEDNGGGGMTVIQTGRGGSYSSIQVGSNRGVTIVGGGVIRVNGVVVGGGQNVVVGGGPVSIVARVPRGSTVNATSTSGSIEVRGGAVDRVSAGNTSGSVAVGTVAQANIRTVSGSIEIRNLTGNAMLGSVSGSIHVTGGPAAHASASTVSGSIHGSGGVELDGSSVSGTVRSR